jgi:hypothetical protein
MQTELLSALIGFAGVIVSVILTYFFTNSTSKKKLALCKEEYLDDKLKGIIEMYQSEVQSLREDVRALTRQNELLKDEILSLKQMLQNRNLMVADCSLEPHGPTNTKKKKSVRITKK